jgi:hypothetical protein
MRVVKRLTQDMVSASHPVLLRNSPLNLTDFGKVVLSTGLSPRSGVALAQFIDTHQPAVEPREGQRRRKSYGISWVPLIATIWEQLTHTDDVWIREIEGYVFDNQIDRHGFPVKYDNFNEVAMAWLSGVPVELISYLIISGNKTQFTQWLNQESDKLLTNYEDGIEEVAIFCKNYLGENWSWVFRGAAAISEYLNCLELSEDFEHFAIRLKHGVRHLETAKLLARDCPVSRAKLDSLVHNYKFPSNISFLVGQSGNFREWLQNNFNQLVDNQVGQYPRIRISIEDLDTLAKFLSGLDSVF